MDFLCSIDPNDKIARPSGVCDAHFVELNELSLEYTIRFQNVGEIYATNVALFDTLIPVGSGIVRSSFGHEPPYRGLPVGFERDSSAI